MTTFEEFLETRVISVDAQEWLDREYPKDGTCRGEFDQKNKDKKREEITKLDFHNIEVRQSYHITLLKLNVNFSLTHFTNFL